MTYVRVSFRGEGAASRPHASLDDQLGQLTERRAELQRLHDHILRARDANTGVVPAPRQIVSDVPLPVTTIFHVQSPPDFPAPTVILDVATLPDRPSRTQCPECKQFIVTETFHSVSSVTWMMCFLVATLGCVAGCCLLPFCMDSCKSTTHRCPRCRTAVRTIKRL
ncbi:lipopolysaccharide-induced tumor necrosis factor-alpha factor-like isoform 3-T3 [Spinachia spinachia]